MNRKAFLQTIASFTIMSSLSKLSVFAQNIPSQSKIMPVLFTSHGNPMDIPLTKEDRPFWNTLFELGNELQNTHEITAALVISAHWCTKGTFVNTQQHQKQIYDYYGFPDEYYKVKYSALGAPQYAQEIADLQPHIKPTTDWGLDHGAWPMLMHLFPQAQVPVFQLSLDYYASPEYHFELGKQLQILRKKGVLIIGSGSLIHNLQLAGDKLRKNDFTPYGWEAEYDEWITKQIDARNFKAILEYYTSHKLGKMAAPTPEHFVPVLYSLGLLNTNENIQYFYNAPCSLPAFSERSFIINQS